MNDKIQLYRTLTNAAYRKHLAILRNHPGELVADVAEAYTVQANDLRRVLNLLQELNITQWVGEKKRDKPVPKIPEIITFEIKI